MWLRGLCGSAERERKTLAAPDPSLRFPSLLPVKTD